MFIYLDTETTGAGADDRICQIAFKTEAGWTVNELFNPGRKISVEAMAIHHITNQIVQGKPKFRGSAAFRKLDDLIKAESNVIVAHNAEFDIAMLKKEGLRPSKFICTLKLARHLDKEGVIPQYNLQYLRYYLDLNIDARPHDALGDIAVLEGLFKRIRAKFKGDGIDEMVRISTSPVLLARMPFGKHKGLLFREIPPDYLEWLLTTDLDGDLVYTVKYHLGVSSQ